MITATCNVKEETIDVDVFEKLSFPNSFSKSNPPPQTNRNPEVKLNTVIKTSGPSSLFPTVPKEHLLLANSYCPDRIKLNQCHLGVLMPWANDLFCKLFLWQKSCSFAFIICF